MPDFSFPKSRHLCGAIRIQTLHRTGRHMVCWPIKVTYLPAETTQVLVWAPKRLFKHAVDRNRLKRQLREAWRLHQNDLLTPRQISFFYIAEEQVPFDRIEKAVIKAVDKLNADR